MAYAALNFYAYAPVVNQSHLFQGRSTLCQATSLITLYVLIIGLSGT